MEEPSHIADMDGVAKKKSDVSELPAATTEPSSSSSSSKLATRPAESMSSPSRGVDADSQGTRACCSTVSLACLQGSPFHDN